MDLDLDLDLDLAPDRAIPRALPVSLRSLKANLPHSIQQKNRRILPTGLEFPELCLQLRGALQLVISPLSYAAFELALSGRDC
jgi:hypothetical protein